jgi:hypothetical protein
MVFNICRAGTSNVTKVHRYYLLSQLLESINISLIYICHELLKFRGVLVVVNEQNFFDT